MDVSTLWTPVEAGGRHCPQVADVRFAEMRGRTDRTERDWMRSMENRVSPLIGDMRVDRIRREDVLRPKTSRTPDIRQCFALPRVRTSIAAMTAVANCVTRQVLALLLLLSTSVEASAAEATTPLAPEGKRWALVWSDEFDAAELDNAKWSLRSETMRNKRRHGGGNLSAGGTKTTM